MNEFYSFAKIDCGSYSLLFNQTQIAKTILYENSKVISSKYKGLFLYQIEPSIKPIPVIDLLQHWKQDKIETEAKCIFYVLIHDPKKKKIVRRLIHKTLLLKIEESMLGVIVPINLADIKQFPKRIKNQLYKKGLLGVIISETQILYWLDLETIVYYIFKELSR